MSELIYTTIAFINYVFVEIFQHFLGVCFHQLSTITLNFSSDTFIFHLFLLKSCSSKNKNNTSKFRRGAVVKSTLVAARLTQPSILPRSVKFVAVLLMLRKCVGVVRIVRDPTGELLRQ